MPVLITPIQCRMARAAFRWTMRDLAAEAKVSPNTVNYFENGGPVRRKSVDAIRQALEAIGVEFPDRYTVQLDRARRSGSHSRGADDAASAAHPASR